MADCCLAEIKALREKVNSQTAAESLEYVKKEIQRRELLEVHWGQRRTGEKLMRVAGRAMGL
jgi:hypothetical protein